MCKIPVSKDITFLSNRSLLCEQDGKDYIPEGFYIIDNEEFFTDYFENYILNLKDVINLKNHFDFGRLNGCCGLDGCDGLNKTCINGHEIGTERSDCWLPHHIHINPEKVEEIK